MTINEKMDRIQNAENRELLSWWFEFKRTNSYGANNEDIQLVEAEILRRMD